MSLFSNSVGVATTATPNFYVDEYEGANIGQYGWTKADQGRYNQLIQYVDECRKIYDQIVEFSSSLAGIGAQVAEVNLIYNKVLEQKRLIDEIYASFNSDFGDFTTKYADFNVNYEAFKVSMADLLLKYAEVVVAAREAKDAATGAKLSETTAAAILKEVQDIYQELKEGQVYRGVWDPTTNTYPDPQGTNSIWDVNFTGKDEYVFDGKTWKPGHRLLCLIGPPREFQQIDTGTGGVRSINGKTGSVTLNAEDVGALPTSGGTVSGSVHLRAPSKQVTFVNTNNYIGMGGNDMYIAALNDSTSRVVLQSNRSPFVRMNNVDYNIYHENNKPTPADIGAVSLSVMGQKISGQIGYQMTSGDNAARGFDYYDKSGNTVARSGLQWEDTTVKNFYFGAGGGEWAGGSTSWFSIKSGGEVYANGTNRVYHQGYKPTAVDVGALPVTGGSISGIVKFSKDNGTYLSDNLSSDILGRNSDKGVYLHNGGSYAIYSGTSLAQPSVLRGSNTYNIYHQGFKPTAADVGAAVSTKSSSDVNNHTTAGFYNVAGTSPNWVGGGSGGAMLVMPHDSWVTQLAQVAGGSTLRIRSRAGSSADWKPWTKVYTETEKPTPDDITAFPALVRSGVLATDPTTWANNPQSGIYTRTIPGASATTVLFNNTGGSSRTIGFTGRYSGQLEYHTNTDANRWVTYTVYTSGNKPTAADVGAVNKAGDTMTGDLLGTGFTLSGRGKLGTTTVDGAGVQPSSIRLYSNLNLWMDAVDAVYLGANYGHSNNGWSKPSTSKPSTFLRVHNNPSQFSLVCSDAGSTNPNQYTYRVYHEGFKPTAYDIELVDEKTKAISTVAEEVSALKEENQKLKAALLMLATKTGVTLEL